MSVTWKWYQGKDDTTTKATDAIEDGKRDQLKPPKEEARYEYGFDRGEAINKKHTAGREGNKQSSNMDFFFPEPSNMDLIGKNATSTADTSCKNSNHSSRTII